MFDLWLLLALIAIGYAVGQYLERSHYKSIEARERELISLITTNGKRPLGELPHIMKAHIVYGNTVISVDYFKRMVAALRNFFGGNVRGYETLLDRARREAIIRMKESCPGAKQIINLRIETSSIYKGKKNQVGSVEVLAYGTAIYT